MELITVLLIYSLAVYGIAWILTKSKLFLFYRDISYSVYVQRRDKDYSNPTTTNRMLLAISEEWSYLSECIVCTSVWVGALLSITASENNVLQSAIVVSNGLDLLTWVGYSCATTWLIAVTVGDAD
tara:strand:- start:843 stop:1220 length:378 start_codon:yes stop_codon:yes gene_type:complete